MATAIHRPWMQFFILQTEVCEPVQCVKGDPKHTVPVPYHESLKNTSHTVLQVREPVSPGPKLIPVSVFNGSSGIRIPVTVRSTDTIGKLKQKLLEVRPDLVNINLLFNGKPVLQEQKMCELQVKPGATFITYQKCRGG